MMVKFKALACVILKIGRIKIKKNKKKRFWMKEWYKRKDILPDMLKEPEETAERALKMISERIMAHLI